MLDLIIQNCDARTAKAIAESVSSLIRQGHLTDGDKLPPIRVLSKELEVSPSTITSAWAILARAGLIWTEGRRGTRVHIPLTEPKRSKRVAHPSVQYSIDLSTRIPDPSLLPDLKLALNNFQEPAPITSYFDVPILPELDRELRARWGTNVDLIALADAAVDALDLICQTFLQLGDWVGVESVTDPQLIDILDASNIRMQPLVLDQSGPTPDSFQQALDKGVRVIFLQPHCHVPLGISMTAERRDELVKILQGHDEVLIVETDLSTGLSLSPAVTLAHSFPDRVIQVRAFSGAYGPELRIAAVGGSHALISELIRKRHLAQGWTSRILQAIFYQFLSQQTHQRSISQARTEYSERRESFAHELRKRGLRVQAPDGLMLWIEVKDETAMMVGLAARGISAIPGSSYRIEPSAQDYICVSVTHLPQALIPKIAQIFATLQS